MRRRSLSIVPAAALALVWVALMGPTAAHAHARLVKSDPAARSVLQAAPTLLRLWFNERIEAKFATVSIIDGQGRNMPAGAPAVAADDARRIDVNVPPLAPGVYRVRYRVLSVDGHTIESEFSFTLKGHDRRAEQPASVARP